MDTKLQRLLAIGLQAVLLEIKIILFFCYNLGLVFVVLVLILIMKAFFSPQLVKAKRLLKSFFFLPILRHKHSHKTKANRVV